MIMKIKIIKIILLIIKNLNNNNFSFSHLFFSAQNDNKVEKEEFDYISCLKQIS